MGGSQLRGGYLFGHKYKANVGESDTHILARAVQSQLGEYNNLKNNVQTFVILFVPNFDIKVRHSTILIINCIYFVWNTFTLLLLTFNNSSLTTSRIEINIDSEHCCWNNNLDKNLTKTKTTTKGIEFLFHSRY